MALPEILKCKVCALHHLKAAVKQVLGEELLEIRDHLLVHGLQNRGGAVWKVENVYKLELLKDLIFEVR